MQIRKINLNKRISAVIFGGGTENFASLLSGARKAGKNYPLFDARHLMPRLFAIRLALVFRAGVFSACRFSARNFSRIKNKSKFGGK